jgi:GH25 family lysozyme M1 (1,4-beta-N-acetylmuramidase)
MRPANLDRRRSRLVPTISLGRRRSRAALRILSGCAALVACLVLLAFQGNGGPPATAGVPATTPAGRLAIVRYNVGAAHSPRLLRMLAGRGNDARESASARPAVATVGLVEGIDVSSHQHRDGAAINWAKVAAAGYKFAFIKATEGSYYVNPYYASDAAAARAAGLIIAPYHFAVPNDSSGTLQADLAMNEAGDPQADGATLPMTLDAEYDPYVKSDHTNMCYGLSPSAMVAWISAFSAEVVRRDGVPPVIYTTAGWWNTCTDSSTALAADPLWIAEWGASPTLPAGWTSWMYWQYTSTASVPGIVTKTDVSYLSGSVIDAATPAGQSGAAGAAAQLDVRTVGAAADTPVSYTATGLPQGLTIDPATGIITGTLPATAGSYPVAVTASAAAAPSQTVSFTWNVHAPVSLVHRAAQRTTAGGAVDLQVLASDGLPGCSLTFTAAGLPPGLSISPCGRIAGFATRPGSYQVTVRAGDSATPDLASTTIGWTVTPAQFGATGRVRLGVDGKCLADLDGKGTTTARIWTCQKSGSQIWTLRPGGTVRVNGRCLAALTGSAGTPVPAMRSCTGRLAQQWQQNQYGGLTSPLSGMCLTDPGASHVNGTAATLAGCDDGANQAWTMPPGTLAPGSIHDCLAGFAAGHGAASRITLTRCAVGHSQYWAFYPSGAITAVGQCLTVAQPAAVGEAVTLASCTKGARGNMKAAQFWQPLPSASGSFIVNWASGLCLERATQAAAGTPLTLGYCTSGYPSLAWRTS